VAINYTATSAINAWLTTTDDDGDALCEGEVTLLAFGWADAAPETTTGVWVLGAALGGVTFIPAGAITGLRPRPSNVESALIGIKEEAAEAHRVASDLQLRFDQVMPQVRATAGLAVGAMETAVDAKEEVEEVSADIEKVEEEVEKVEERQATDSIAAAKSASGSRQRPAGRASTSKTTGRAPTRPGPKKKTRQTVG
jgi:predicted transcriptional regulator